VGQQDAGQLERVYPGVGLKMTTLAQKAQVKPNVVTDDGLVADKP